MVALAGLVMQFEMQFTAVVYHLIEEEKQDKGMFVTQVLPGGWNYISGVSGWFAMRARYLVVKVTIEDYYLGMAMAQ